MIKNRYRLRLILFRVISKKETGYKNIVQPKNKIILNKIGWLSEIEDNQALEVVAILTAVIIFEYIKDIKTIVKIIIKAIVIYFLFDLLSKFINLYIIYKQIEVVIRNVLVKRDT